MPWTGPTSCFQARSAREGCRRPRNGELVALERVVRYLLGKPRMVWRFVWQDTPKFLSAFSDSNWAGCHDTRKSTSGACFMHGSHLLKAYSYTQSNIARSSGEAEFCGLVSTSSEALGLVAMSEDFATRLMRSCMLMPARRLGWLTERGWGGSAISTLNRFGFIRRSDSAGLAGQGSGHRNSVGSHD